jgi:hypothetical protein
MGYSGIAKHLGYVSISSILKHLWESQSQNPRAIGIWNTTNLKRLGTELRGNYLNYTCI